MCLPLPNRDKLLHHDVQIPHNAKIPGTKGSQPTNESHNKIAS